MKIIKNEGTFRLVRITPDPIDAIITAARVCYQSEKSRTPEADDRLIKNIIELEHDAMMEFADMTILFNNVSRGFTHEMVRHRMSSFAQESTRYVNESDLNVIVPPHRDENRNIINDKRLIDGVNLKDWFDMNESAYRCLIKDGWALQDARQVLPIATKSQIIVKANFREWIHIFKLRCGKSAHWEIRKVMIDLLEYCQRIVPIVFDDFHEIKIHDSVGKYMTRIPSGNKIKNMISLWESINGIPFNE